MHCKQIDPNYTAKYPQVVRILRILPQGNKLFRMEKMSGHILLIINQEIINVCTRHDYWWLLVYNGNHQSWVICLVSKSAHISEHVMLHLLDLSKCIHTFLILFVFTRLLIIFFRVSTSNDPCLCHIKTFSSVEWDQKIVLARYTLFIFCLQKIKLKRAGRKVCKNCQ